MQLTVPEAQLLLMQWYFDCMKKFRLNSAIVGLKLTLEMTSRYEYLYEVHDVELLH